MTDAEFQKLAELYGFAPSRSLRELVEAVERMEHMRRGQTFAQTLQDRLDETLEQRDALLEALKWIADHDLSGTDLMVAGHMAHGFIGRARAAVSAFEGAKV